MWHPLTSSIESGTGGFPKYKAGLEFEATTPFLPLAMSIFGITVDLNPSYGAYLIGTFISNMYVLASLGSWRTLANVNGACAQVCSGLHVFRYVWVFC
jgi:hypothetical protein